MKRYKKVISLVLAVVLSAGTICLGTAVGLSVVKAEEATVIQQDVPNWKDAVTEALGEDVIAGAAVTYSELSDKAVFALLTKHCNATTFGNELKPDCMFGYSNDNCPGTEEIVFNGKKMLVPIPNFSRADKMLAKIKQWNDEHPDDFIKIRGHVLLWHSQTPEWFFHEDYIKTNDYVDKATMNLRLEWYIKTVLEHYVGEESPYRDMFYGWDVVNEAISDGGPLYRTDVEGGSDKLSDSTHGSKSSWWHVYESNEFIINAFKYANKYAPASLELYYNDYGDISPQKREKIKQLLTAVKEAEGEPGEGTRIDAFGMQAHYGMDDFSLTEFENSVREYASVVGAVQLTELDFKASKSYDGSAEKKEGEYVAQGLQYQAIFETLTRLHKEEGIRITGITFWGTVDKYSWLQSRSNVGGGADGKQTQCPLLFDDDYQVKPAFWAFVDPMKIAPAIKKVEITQTSDGKFARRNEYTYTMNGVEVTFVPLWNEEGLMVKASVTDKTRDDSDCVTVYAAVPGEEPVSATVSRGESKSKGGGYEATILLPLKGLAVGQTIGLDVVTTDGNLKNSFNDIHNTQDTNTDFYAKATLKPDVLPLAKGSATVDGTAEDIWDTALRVPLTKQGKTGTRARVKLLWDFENLYVFAEVADKTVTAGDVVEIYLDGDNDKNTKYDKKDGAIILSSDGSISTEGKLVKEKHVQSKVTATENGYHLEASIAWNAISPKVHSLLGLEVRVCDKDAEGKLLGSFSFANSDGDLLSDPSCFGTVIYAVEGEVQQKEEELTVDETVLVDEEVLQEEGTEQDNEKSNGFISILLIVVGLIFIFTGVVSLKKRLR